MSHKIKASTSEKDVKFTKERHFESEQISSADVCLAHISVLLSVEIFPAGWQLVGV